MSDQPNKETFEIPLLKDMHQHLREGDEVSYTTAWADRWCDDIVAMSNLRNPLTNAGLIQQYRQVLAPHYKNAAKAIIPLYITEQTTPDDIRSAHEAGVRAAKFYPRGKTSHSGHGIVDFAGRIPVLKEMARVGMRALLHPEHPHSNAWESEADFIREIFWPIFYPLVRVEGLYVCLEHISARDGLWAVEDAAIERVVATVTPHHLLAHVGHIGDQWDSALMCKPMLKDPDDRQALIDAVTGGHDRLSLGSDSAPWPLVSKARIKSCSGCWTAPWLPQLVTTIFDRAGRLDNLVKFTHDNAVRWWGLEPSAGRIRLTRGETVIPEIDHGYWLGYLPFLGGQTLPWKAERILEGVNDASPAT